MGEEETLLLNATMIPLTEAPALVREYGGVCYPAHIDKIANSVLAILGSIPPECEEEFDTVEVSPRYEDGLFPDVEAAREHRRTVVSSDAHYLWDIAEAGHEFEPGDDGHQPADPGLPGQTAALIPPYLRKKSRRQEAPGFFILYGVL